MDEEKQKTEDKKPEDSIKDTDEGVQHETVSELDRADQIAERQKRENDRREKLLEREEALEARRAVGGGIERAPPAEKPKEISDKEYAEKALSGDLNVKKE